LPPSACYQAIGFRIDTNGNVEDILSTGGAKNYPAYTVDNPQLTASTFAQVANSFRMSYRSTTITQDSTAFNNNTKLFASQFRPAVQVFSFEGGFTHLGPSARKDETHEFKSRFASHSGAASVFKDIDASLVNMIQIISLDIIPTNGGAVLMTDPKRSYEGNARDGLFMVHHFSQTIQEYKSVTRDYLSLSPSDPTANTTNARTRCYFEYYASGAWHLRYLQSSSGGNGTYDLPWYDMTWGMVLHDYTAGMVSAGTVSAQPIAPLCMKTIFALEVQPTAGSILQPVNRTAAPCDDAALRSGAIVSKTMPHAMPASANFWGTALKIATQAAPAIIDILGTLFKKEQPAKKEKKPAPAPAQPRVARTRAVKFRGNEGTFDTIGNPLLGAMADMDLNRRLPTGNYRRANRTQTAPVTSRRPISVASVRRGQMNTATRTERIMRKMKR
jgi:hypothetical protein